MDKDNKKISVKYYLNKRVKPIILSSQQFYPLYIKISVKGIKAEIKSKIYHHLKIYRSDLERITKNDAELTKCFIDSVIFFP